MLRITPTLYSSWHYYVTASENYRDKAYDDFLHVLNRVKTKPTKAQQLGLDYETKIQAMAERCKLSVPWDNNDKDIPEVDKQIAELLQNCIWQIPISRPIEINSRPILLSGRVDAFDPDTQTIYDLKYTSRNYEPGMFESSIQHLVYMYALQTPKFRYIVRNKSKHFLTDDYYYLSTEDLLRSRLNYFLFWIRNNPREEQVFLTKWSTAM